MPRTVSTVTLVAALSLAAACGRSELRVRRDAAHADAIVAPDHATADAIADARPSDALPDLPGDSACMCPVAQLTWRVTGGFVGCDDNAILQNCAQFTFEQVMHPDPNPACTNAFACSAPGTVDASTLATALADPDVVRALASAPILYGVDDRPADGMLLDITVDGRRISVGDPCPMPPGSCLAPTPGIVRLVALLRSLRQQQFARPGCVEVFGMPGSTCS